MAIVCQFAAATSAPRLSRSSRFNRFQCSTRVFCDSLGASPGLGRLGLRLAAAGAAAAVLVWAAGTALERARFGASDEESVGRIETALRQQFDQSASRLASIANRVASDLT